MIPLTISKITRRRFILGQQGLWPGRRWRGKAGLAETLRAGSVVQIDPLRMVARSHDIALYGRVLDYHPGLLNEMAYTDRLAFDYGGTVLVCPMEHLPYWRVVMARNALKPRWAAFAERYGDVLERVKSEIAARGPLSRRDFKGSSVARGNYRGSTDTGLALYTLWFAGDLMTWNRLGNGSGGSFERLYDLRERVAPPGLQWSASPEQAEDFFALETFRSLGLPSERSWRGWFGGTIERLVGEGEARERLAALLKDGMIGELAVEGDPRPHFALAADLARLEVLQGGGVPLEWLPLETTTEEEMTVLAPLEIASARGRARVLFDFDYVWEVYKPVEQRRWGYYTLPLLWGDRLVARFDSRLDHERASLVLLGFWLEDGVAVDERFRSALRAGLRRFARFAGAERIESESLLP